MKKEAIKNLAFGFLASAILTGAFAILVQGNVPVKGMDVTNLLPGANKASIEANESQIELLAKDKADLSSENQALQESMSELNEEIASLEKQVKGLSKNNDKADETSESSNESGEANESNESSSETTTTTSAEKVTFTVNPGEDSTSIVNRLEAEGIINSASDLQAIFDNWNLNTILVADTYQFTKGMDPNVVAEMLTGGAYYYQP